MTSGDLISMLGYYIGILAIALAFFATQIEAWKSRVLALESEWSRAEQQANTQVERKQRGELATLKASKPLLALVAPVLLGVALLVLGYIALLKAKPDVPKSDFSIFLLAPSLILLLLYLLYGIGVWKFGSRRLASLR
jgi:hypothetical protein